MNLPLLATTIIGSMPKPAWLTSEWFSITEKWRLSGKELEEAFDDATRLALADQEHAGIDIVCDGEQRRPTHFSYFLAQLNNVDFVNLGARARRGGNTKTPVPRITGPISLRTHNTLDDFHALRKLTKRPIKMTLPGPCTLVDGSDDHYYGDERTLAFAFADALNAEIRALAAAGCDMVQIDEPSITRLPEQVHTWGVEAMDRAFEGAAVTSCVHVCYGYRSRQGGGKEWKYGYDEILPALAHGKAQQYSLEFAEPDLPAKILDMLPGKIIQLGVIDVGREVIETPALVETLLRYHLQSRATWDARSCMRWSRGHGECERRWQNSNSFLRCVAYRVLLFSAAKPRVLFLREREPIRCLKWRCVMGSRVRGNDSVGVDGCN
jgi:5-methyltetrahydropteroyltriglutamate--homocysteine methyltransferase